MSDEKVTPTRAEAELLESLRRCGVHVKEPYVDEGAVTVVAEVGSGGGAVCSMMGWGASLDAALAHLEDRCAAAGRIAEAFKTVRRGPANGSER